jgi:arsenate reductase-like glutaredoxin family protein
MFKPEAYVDSVLDLLDDEQTLVAENIIKNPLDMQERYMSLVPDGLLDFIVKQWRPGMTSDQADKIFRKYSSFNQGGSVTTPKRGLVDEPGSYAGKGFVTPPNPNIPKESVEEFIAQQGVDKWEDVNKAQRSRFNREVGEKIKQFKKDTKGLISRQELADLIGLDNDYLRAINKSREYQGGRNPKYELVSEILGESTKIYRPVSGYNMGYYKKPSAADIKKIKEILDADILNQKVINRVNTLTSNKKFMNMLKNTNLTDKNFLPKVKSMFPNLDLTDKKLADAILLIARGSEGANLTGIDLKSDKGLSKKLLKQFETAKWGNPFHQAAYKYASTKIDEQLGSKVGTFKSYQASINKKLKDLGIDTKNYNIDEFVGVSIGGKQEAAPYSVFTQITDAKYNQGPAAAYQGKLSQASTKLSNIINQYGSDSKEAKDFVKNFNNTTALNHEKKYNAKVAKLDLRTPEESFGKKRFNQLGTLGDQIKTSFEEKGFGYKLPKNAMTQKELLSSKEIKNSIEKIGCTDLAAGGRVGFNTGANCYLKGVEKINSGKIAKGAEARNFVKFANQAYKLGRNVLKFGVIPEMLWIGGETLIRMGMGEGLNESFKYATSFLPGGTARAKEADLSSLTKRVGLQNAKTIMNVRGANESREKLNDLYNSLETDLAFAGGDWQAQADIEKRYEKRIGDAEEEYNIKSDFGKLDDISSGANIAARRLGDEAEDIKKSKSLFTQMKNWADEIRPDTVEGDIETVSPSESDLDIGKTKTVPLFTMEDIAKNLIFDQYAKDPKEKLKILQGMREDDVNPGETDLERILFEQQQGGIPTVNEFVWRDIFSKAAENPAYAEQLYGASGMMGEPIQNSIIRANQAFPKTYGTFASGGIASLTTTIPPKRGPNHQGLASLKKYGKQY